MAKDPAFLFYSNDFISGTYTMSDEQVGKYIRLLCIQHQKGFLVEKDMMKICKSYDEDIFNKFVLTDGHYVNERLDNEAKKRKMYSESRSENRKGKVKNAKTYDTTYVSHMENINIDISNITYEGKNFFSPEKDSYTKEELFEIFWKRYPEKDGKKAAQKHFNSSVNSVEDVYNLDKAITNYLRSGKVNNGFIKNGSTFFNNWKDFIDYSEGRNEIKKITGNQKQAVEFPGGDAFGEFAK